MVLAKRVPIKAKYVRSNHSPVLNEQVLKAFMDRVRLQTKKCQTTIDKLAYNKQINPVLSLVGKTEKKITVAILIRKM